MLRRVAQAEKTQKPDEDEDSAYARLKASRESLVDSYEEIGGKAESRLRSIKLIERGEQVQINRIEGYLPGRIVQFVMNLNFGEQKFIFTRHGQREYNTTEQIGGDSRLSPAGEEYALALAEFAKKKICKDENGKILRSRLWTSSLRRTIMTARHIEQPVVPPDEDCDLEWIQMRPRVWRNLDEIYAGVCDGMTYKQIEQEYTAEFKARSLDKLSYRYPRGESYLDVIQRLDPIVQEMQRCKQPLLVVGHQGILRILYAYFIGIDRDKAPKLSIPLNTVICLDTTMNNCHEHREQLIGALSKSQLDAPSI